MNICIIDAFVSTSQRPTCIYKSNMVKRGHGPACHFPAISQLRDDDVSKPARESASKREDVLDDHAKFIKRMYEENPGCGNCMKEYNRMWNEMQGKN